jgi:hypothetical protein
MCPESRLRRPPKLLSPAKLELVAWEHDLGVGLEAAECFDLVRGTSRHELRRCASCEC